MAIRQKLKGDQNNPRISKTYDVLLNFDRGIDKQAADDLASDSSFRELSNFYNKQDGVLSKRPGVYDTKFTDVMQDVLKDGALCSRPIIQTFDNQFSKKFGVFVNNVLNGQRISLRTLFGEYSGFDYNFHYVSHFKPETIIGIQILKDDKFHTLLENYKVGETNLCGSGGIPDTFEFNALIVCSGYLESEIEIHGGVPTFAYQKIPNYGGDTEFLEGIIITKLHIKKETSTSVNITFDIEQTGTVYNVYVKENKELGSDDELRWGFNLGHSNALDIVSYNDYSYIPTGSNYLIRVQNEFPTSTAAMGIRDISRTGYTITDAMKESNMITQIGGAQSENIYEPAAVELSNIGFNILAKNPLSAYKKEGATDAIKGVFYTVTRNGVDEPITDIPPNDAFSIHIIETGSTSLDPPEYREDNGETDVSINPYKSIPGSFDSNDPSIFNCTGIDFNGKLEMKFTKGSNVTYISYVSTGTSYNKQVGTLADVTKLIYSSSRMKVINSQLVLFGKHGYIFFSDYDNFTYFPNYFYVYAVSDADEEEVTGINYFRQYYAVFTNKKIRRMTGSFGSENFGLYPLSDFIGCPNGRTIRQVNNNLLFVGIDGIYKLKQGYLGEGTENVEKIDTQLGNLVNSNNVNQCFVLNNYYLLIRNDNDSILAYNFIKDTFFEIKLESATPLMALNPNIKIDSTMLNYYFDSTNEVCYEKTIPLKFGEIPKDANPFKLCFQNELYDEHGASIYIPEYEYDFELSSYEYLEYPVYGLNSESGHIYLRKLRISDLEFIEESERHKDGIGYISELETPKLSMGSPTNTKKFKELYIKMINDSGTAIPLYITIYIDDVAYITPEDYEVKYDNDTNTFYYIYTSETNATLEEGAEILKAQDVLGELVLGEDKLGNNTIYQLKIKINKKGRSIKVKISDGYNDIYDVTPIEGMQNKVVTCERYRNTKDFTIIAVGIVYKLKKVKEG